MYQRPAPGVFDMNVVHVYVAARTNPLKPRKNRVVISFHGGLPFGPRRPARCRAIAIGHLRRSVDKSANVLSIRRRRATRQTVDEVRTALGFVVIREANLRLAF